MTEYAHVQVFVGSLNFVYAPIVAIFGQPWRVFSGLDPVQAEVAIEIRRSTYWITKL